MDKSRLLDIFSNIKKDEMPSHLHQNSRVLIIDGMNMFIRSFAVINKVNYYGQDVGGLIGFLRSLGSVINLFNPTKVIVVFDGEAGSTNRKYLYPEYKSNRTQYKIMNYKSFSSVKEESDSMNNQIERLIDYVKCLPVVTIVMDKLEADDVIGHLSGHIYKQYTDSEVFIISTDNDFLQLVNNRVKYYNTKRKKIYNPREVVEEYGVHPNNFVIFKTLIGDVSDNIPGIQGFGKVNTPKIITFLKEDTSRTLEDLYEHCKTIEQKHVICQRLLNIKKTVETFYKIMDLKNPNISDEDIKYIEEVYSSEVPDFNKVDFLKMYAHDKMGGAIPNVNTWIDLFSYLKGYK